MVSLSLSLSIYLNTHTQTNTYTHPLGIFLSFHLIHLSFDPLSLKKSYSFRMCVFYYSMVLVLGVFKYESLLMDKYIHICIHSIYVNIYL